VVGYAQSLHNGIYEFDEYDKTWINQLKRRFKIQEHQLSAWLKLCSKDLSTRALRRIKKSM